MKRLNRFFITGILMTLPIAITIYILIVTFQFVDNILGKYINVYFQKAWGFYVPGLGIILFAAIMIFIGFLGSYLGIKLVHKYLDRILVNFPLLKYVYAPLKQMFEFIFSQERSTFKKAVLVEFPGKGVWSLGFVTNETFKEAKEKISQEMLNVFVPLAPNPTTGFVVIVKKEEMVFLDMEIKEAMKLVISGGLLNPKDSLERAS